MKEKQPVPIVGEASSHSQGQQLAEVLSIHKEEGKPKNIHPNLVIVTAGAEQGVHWVLLKKTGKASLQIIDPYGTKISAVNGLINRLQEEGWKIEYQPTGQQPQEDVDTCGYRVSFWVEQYLADERANTINKVSEWNPPCTTNSIVQAVATSMGVQVKTSTQQTNKEITRTKDGEKREKKHKRKRITQDEADQTNPNKIAEIALASNQGSATQSEKSITITPTRKTVAQKNQTPRKTPEYKRRKARKEHREKYGVSIYSTWKAKIRREKYKKMDRFEKVREVRQTKIYTHNMQGGWTGAKRQLIAEWLKTEEPGAMMLQEPHITPGQDTQWYLYGAPYQTITHTGNCQLETGLVTLIHNKIAHRIVHKKIQKDAEGRMLAIPLTTYTPNKLLWIINRYGPATKSHKKRKSNRNKKTNKRKISGKKKQKTL